MSNGDYENCKAKIYIENLKEELKETKEHMSKNIGELYDRCDDIIESNSNLKLDISNKINEEGKRTDKRFWGIFFGLLVTIGTIVITRFI